MTHVSVETAKTLIKIIHPKLTFVNGVSGSGKHEFLDYCKRNEFSAMKLDSSKSDEELKNSILRRLRTTPPHIPILISGNLESTDRILEIFSDELELFTYLFLYINNNKKFYEKIKLKGKTESPKSLAKQLISQNKKVYSEHSETMDLLTVLVN